MSYRRPSKSQIVEKALDWVKQGISREDRYRSQIIHLQRENKQLLAQLMQYQQDSNPSSNSLTSNTNSTASHVTAESVYAGMNSVYPWPVPGLMNSTQPITSSGSMDDVSRQSLSSPRTDASRGNSRSAATSSHMPLHDGHVVDI